MNARKRRTVKLTSIVDGEDQEQDQEQTASSSAAPELTAVPDHPEATEAPPADQAPAEAETAAAPAAERPARPRKKAPAARQPHPPRKTAQKPAQPALAALETFFTEGDPHVLSTDVDGAERVNLYLHPTDKAMLDMAKINDRADLNARFRAMLAVYRSNKRFRTLVDKYARTAPRGGGH